MLTQQSSNARCQAKHRSARFHHAARHLHAALIERSLAEGVAVTATAVEANTIDVDSFGRAIAPLAVELGARLTEVAPLDDDLESVFRYLVERR